MIQAGIDRIDRTARPGWQRAISLTNLNMMFSRTCIVGQLNVQGYLGAVNSAAPYLGGLKAMGVTPNSPECARCGFTFEPGSKQTFRDLEDAWRTYLQPFQVAP